MSRQTWIQSRQATKDLIGIRDHTVATGGPEQAKVYLKGIRSAVERVVANPSQRQRYGDELPDYFRVIVGLHVVFYREVGNTIRIERFGPRRRRNLKFGKSARPKIPRSSRCARSRQTTRT